jgi:hypothetical protein
MTVPPDVEGEDGTVRGRVHVDAARLWTGGLATVLAAIAALLTTGLMHLLLLSTPGPFGSSPGSSRC